MQGKKGSFTAQFIFFKYVTTIYHCPRIRSKVLLLSKIMNWWYYHTNYNITTLMMTYWSSNNWTRYTFLTELKQTIGSPFYIYLSISSLFCFWFYSFYLLDIWLLWFINIGWFTFCAFIRSSTVISPSIIFSSEDNNLSRNTPGSNPIL